MRSPTIHHTVQAAKAGRVDVVQKLIQLGVQLTAQDSAGNTPLHMAVKLKASKTYSYTNHDCTWARVSTAALLTHVLRTTPSVASPAVRQLSIPCWPHGQFTLSAESTMASTALLSNAE